MAEQEKPKGYAETMKEYLFPAQQGVNFLNTSTAGIDLFSGVQEKVGQLDTYMKAVFAGPEGWVAVAMNMVGRLIQRLSEGSEREQQFSERFNEGVESVESSFQYGDTKVATIEHMLEEISEQYLPLGTTSRTEAMTIRDAARSAPQEVKDDHWGILVGLEYQEFLDGLGGTITQAKSLQSEAAAKFNASEKTEEDSRQLFADLATIDEWASGQVAFEQQALLEGFAEVVSLARTAAIQNDEALYGENGTERTESGVPRSPVYEGYEAFLSLWDNKLAHSEDKLETIKQNGDLLLNDSAYSQMQSGYTPNRVNPPSAFELTMSSLDRFWGVTGAIGALDEYGANGVAYNNMVKAAIAYNGMGGPSYTELRAGPEAVSQPAPVIWEGYRKDEPNTSPGLGQQLIDASGNMTGPKLSDLEGGKTESITAPILAAFASEDLWASVSESINTGLAGTLTSAMEGLTATMSEQGSLIGQAIAEGIARGVEEKSDRVRRAVEQLATVATRTVTIRLSINSPSKVFQKLGESVGEGFALGIDESTLMAESAAVHMASRTALAGAANAAGGAGAGSGPVINLNLNKATVRSDEDVRRLSNELGYYTKSVLYGRL